MKRFFYFIERFNIEINFKVIENAYVVNPLALTPFTAFLWPHDGDYMNAEISVLKN